MVLAAVNTASAIYKDYSELGHMGHGWVDGAAIFGAVFIIIAITSGNNYSKEKQFQKLVAKAAIEYVAVYRGGNGLTQTINVADLVVGDIIKLE